MRTDSRVSSGKEEVFIRRPGRGNVNGTLSRVDRALNVVEISTGFNIQATVRQEETESQTGSIIGLEGAHAARPAP